jgi:hypothetical protein
MARCRGIACWIAHVSPLRSLGRQGTGDRKLTRFDSIIFPSIFSLGVAELGPLTGDGSGLLNMAIGGGAVVPVLQRVIADRIGIHHAFFLPVICYIYTR